MTAHDGLEVTGLTVRYGGVVAVDDVNLAAPSGQVTGLIGPNGAGKTSIFNACTGFTPIATGRLVLRGIDITRHTSQTRAQLGLGRTFQRARLFETLTVGANVAAGAEAKLAGSSVLRQIWARPRDRRRIDELADVAMERVGILGLREKLVGTLTTGQRRLVDVARALACEPEMLLMDEPSAGLDVEETGRLGDLMVSLAHEGRLGIWLVEHDMSLVARVCSFVYVVDFGRLISEGPLSEVLADERVRAAYLGEETDA